MDNQQNGPDYDVQEIKELVETLTNWQNEHFTQVISLLNTLTDKVDELEKRVNEITDDDEDELSDDDLYNLAKETVIEIQRASTSLLQRTLRIGYARAAQLMGKLEEDGIIAKGEGTTPRKVLIIPQVDLE